MSRSPVLLISLLIIVAGAGPEPSASTASGQDEPLARLIVKLREPLAREVEASLPASLRLERGEEALSPRPRAFLERHRGLRLRPLHPRLVRDKKERRVSARELALASRRRFAARAARLRARFQPPDLSRTYVLEIPAATRKELDQAIATVARDGEVEYVEEDRVVPLHLIPDDPYFSTSGSWGQSYDDLYGLKKIGAPAAWDVTTGAGVVVAVVDTGLDAAHLDVAGNVWTNLGEVADNSVDDDGNGYVDDAHGWDFIGATHTSPAQDNDPSDGHGHGTHVAGTVAALGNNGIGVVGVAWGAKVMAVKGLSDAGYGLDSGLASAVLYAADNGADVINASWGGFGTSRTLQDAVDYAYSLGAVFVASAGNSSDDVWRYYPASFPSVITVAASDPRDAVAYFSNWGSKIDVAAPGVDILSLRAAGTNGLTPLGADYARASGTSMAAPHVSGLAALLLALHPDFSIEQVRQALRVSAYDADATGVDWHTGYGRIDAAQALAVSDPLEARILSPLDGTRVSSETTVAGLARGAGFGSYVLELGAGETPTSWTELVQGSAPVGGGTIGVMDPSGWPDGLYSLRLRVTDGAGLDFVDRIRLVVDYVSISSPVPPVTPNTATVFKPGELVAVEGKASGSSFQSFAVQWARGVNPTGGWSDSGVTLLDGGTSPVSGGTIATWDTTGVSEADFYTLRVVVPNAGFTSEARTRVYLEPDLLSPYWPRWLDVAARSNAGVVPARNAAGDTRLTLNIPFKGNVRARFRTFSPDGSSESSVDMWGGPFQQPVALDFDGQPGEEAAVNEGLAVRVYREVLTNFTLPTARTVNFQWGLASTADLDGDSTAELLAVGTDFSTESAYLHAWRRDGQQLTPSFPIPLADVGRKTHYQASGPRFLVVDLEGDGVQEIVVAEGPTATSFRLNLFARDGTPRAWEAPEIEGQLHQMLASDLDRDGRYEIIVSYVTTVEAVVTVLDFDGALRAGWPATVRNNPSDEPYLAVGDLDRDGRDEVVVSTFWSLTVLREDGTPFSPAWPYKTCPCWVPVLADVDGDGYVEILVTRDETSTTPPLTEEAVTTETIASAADGDLPEPQSHPPLLRNSETKLLALGRDATIVRSWRLLGAQGNQSIGFWDALATGDFDGDGTLDIAVTYPIVEGAGGFGVVNGGVLTVLGTGAPAAPEAQDWPMNYHDSRNTAVRPRRETVPPTVAITAPVDGATLTGTLTVRADASDQGRVLGVQFYIDGSPLGPEDTAPPYAVEWNTRGVANGSHALTAVARDLAANRSTSAPVNVTTDNDFTPPAVAVTTPADGAAVRGGLTVAAEASDNVGVVGVQFRLDGASLGAEDTEAPYTVVWDTASTSNGPHTLRAVARDAVGNVTTSAAVNVTVDNQSPVVAMTAPANGAIVRGSASVAASASDNLGVAGVQFRLDGADLGPEDTVAPYSIDWDTASAANGAHTLTAVARDLAGNITVAAGVDVTVDNQAPTVTITAPPNGATVAGPVSITAEASDNRAVSRVEFLVDDVLKSTDTEAPYAYAWDTTAVPNGSHVLVARAYDSAGNAGTSAPLTVQVSNTIVTAVYDGVLKAPRCASAGSVCDSGTLLNGRAGLGPEPNQPNTINNSCSDGTAGTYHGDESNDRLRVSTVDGSLLAPGKLVRVEATVWAYGGFSSDKLDLYYAAQASSPSWVFMATLSPTRAGAQILSTTYTLPSGALQAVRARFRYGGSADACGAGSYNDHDDLVFAVDVPPDRTPPTVSLTAPAEGATVAGTVSVVASASDDVGVVRVEFYVDEALASTDTTAPYDYSWDTTTFSNGNHRLTARAYDAAGNVGVSETVTVAVSNASETAVYDPVLKAPRCGTVGSFCDSGTLLNGRAGLGPEPNQPNTINNSCSDGTSGGYHADESSDRVKVSTVDGESFAAGKTVRVEVTVWAYTSYTSDKLDLYYAADASSPSWVFIATLSPTAAGAQTLTTTFTLPSGALQAVRARFRYGGNAVPCGAGSYNDHDDLVFAVN